MKKLIQFPYIVLSLLLMPFLTSGQSYLKMIDAGTYPVQEVIDSAEAYFAGKDLGRGSGYKQFKRWEYKALRMQDEQGMLKSSEYYIAELERHNAELNADVNSRNSLGDFWSEMGPTSWSATSGWNPGIGRVTGFTVDPDDHNHIIIGANTGGVWRTTDGGVSWSPLNDYFSNMSVYATAMHPIDKSTYFFGSDGGRIYKSTDSGATWTQMASAGGSLINRILIHPENPSTMFAASQWDGLYRSDDGGESWGRITEDINGFDFQFKPGNFNTIYATGTSFHKSTDGGLTFSSVEIPQMLTVWDSSGFVGNYQAADNVFSPGRVPVPSFPDSIHGELALYVDTDDSNLGCTMPLNAEELAGKIVLVRRGDCPFVEKVINAQNAGAIAVIVINSVPGIINMSGANGDIVIPAVAIDRSVGLTLIAAVKNNTLTATLMQPISANFKNGAKMIGVSKDNPDMVYILEESSRAFGGLYKSMDGGETFEMFNHEQKNFFGYSTEAADDRGQAPRDMAIAVNPFDANEVHVAGINTWASYDGGVTFRPTSDWVPNNTITKGIGYCHADVDIMEFVDSTLYVGTDGGFYKTEDSKDVSRNFYTDLSAGLGIRQFYKIGISQTNPVVVSGGSQDNGTSAYMDDRGWIDWLGADGMETFIDKVNPDIFFGTSQNGSMYFSTNRGNSYSGISKPGSESGNWVTPFEQDPILFNTIYVGYEQVFRSDNRGNSWTPISQEFPAKLNHLKIAPWDNNVMFGAYENQLFRTTNGGQDNWTQLSGFAGNINEIAIHPSNPDKVAIATSGGDKVYVSEDGGNSWTSYRKNLPNFQALSLVWQDNLTLEDTDGLYLGMNYGIFYIDNFRDEWVPFSNNLPNVIINELEINYVDGNIYAATYGRGLWYSPIVEQSLSTRENLLNEQVNVYPNPTSGELNIHWTGAEKISTDIRIFDVNGRLLRYEQNQFPENHRIDLSAFQPGVYFVRCNNRIGVATKKISVF